MLNYIWLGMILVAVIVGGINGRFEPMTKGAFETAEQAVMKIALPLAGVMAIWLGVMRLAERSGLVQILANVLRPVLVRLFPDVPAGHPAHGAMVMNMAANMLGLGNAATPLGLRAMALLETLNPRPGTATNAMVTFLTINTASIQLVPTTAISILAIAGSKSPAEIVPAAFLATVFAAAAGITAAKLLQRLPMFALPAVEPKQVTADQAATEQAGEVLEIEKIEVKPLVPWKRGVLIGYVLFFVMLLVMMVGWPADSLDSRPPVIRALFAASILAVPFLLSFFPLYASLRGVEVYSQFAAGAREAFDVALRIIPFLVAMLVAIRLLREAGVIDAMTGALQPILSTVKFPAELVPMVLLRPLSGSATNGVFVEIAQRFGGDAFISKLAGTIYGSTETTFYVLAVYFGSVKIMRGRHAIIAGLTADAVAVTAAFLVCKILFGGSMP